MRVIDTQKCRPIRWRKAESFNVKIDGVHVQSKSVIKACEGKSKVKFHPRTGQETPEGEQTYSSTLSLTSALYGGEWSKPRPDRFTPGKDPIPTV